MGIFYNEDDYKILVILGKESIEESARITKKGSKKPIIVVRSSYEHEEGDETRRSTHRPGIKLKKGDIYGDYGLEIFTTDEKGNVGATLAPNSEYNERSDKKFAEDFIKKYHEEIDLIYNAKPTSKEYDDYMNDLENKIKNDKKYKMERNKK